MTTPRREEVEVAGQQRLVGLSANSSSLAGAAFVSDVSEAKRSQLLLDWLKSGGLLMLTVTGVILYIVFSVPATIFYDRLGTTPQEVGITYTSILSGSTLGAFAIIGVLAFTLLYLALNAIYVTIPSLGQKFYAAFLKNRSILFKRDWQLDADQFNNKLETMKNFYLEFRGFDERDWRRLEGAKRRVRALNRLGVLTADQTYELKSLESLIKKDAEPNLTKTLTVFFRRHIAPWTRPRRILFLAVVIVIVLPVLAFIQAGQVLNGESYSGSQLGIFD
jgi:hypothetical protein